MRALFLVAILVVGCGGTAATSAPQSGAVSPAAATAAPTGTVGATTAPTAAVTAAPTAQPATATPTVTAAPTAAPTRAPTPTPTAPPTPAVTIPPTPGSQVPLEVVEFGFSEVSGPVYYGIIVENPNTEWAVFGTGVEITFLDGSGNELTTVGGLIANLLPGQTAAIGDNSFSGAGAKSMKVELVEGEWVPMAATPDALTVSDVVTRTAGGQMTTTGSITSTLDQPLDFVVVSAIYRNDAGKIIGGAHAITQVAGAGETPFEIQALEPLPAKSTEAYLSY